jgi:two-component system sensor histidine kinase/response regulator
MNGNLRKSVLIIDDSATDLAVLAEILGEEYLVQSAASGAEAQEIVLRGAHRPDLILLDVKMPEPDGLAFCRMIQADPSTRGIPVIFVTSADREEDEAEGFAAGGVDYVTKPVNPYILRARVRTHLELKAAREELESQNATLKENIRLREQVEHLTRHDLKNPLMVILNIPPVLMQRPEIGADEVKWLRMILDSGRRMLNIINMSSGMLKMEQGTYVPHAEPVDALFMVRQISDEIARTFTDGAPRIIVDVEGRTAGASDSFTVKAEEPLLYTMLSNLIRNAVEASPRGSVVFVSFSREATAVIAIHNQGSIPADIRPRLFQKYVTSGKEAGTGLGLYSARLSARTLGGDLTCDTSEESGTTMTVTLPLPDAAPPR